MQTDGQKFVAATTTMLQAAAATEIQARRTKIESVLLVEDNAGDARLLREMFNEQSQPQNTKLTHVTSMAEAEAHLAEHSVDIILLDLGLPDAQGLAALRRAHAAAPRVPLVVLTGMDDESLATQALQEGAQDYLIKGQIETRGLLRALRYAIERNIMDEALFVEKERAEVTLNSIGDAVICTDTSENITFLNGVAEKMTGWSLHEAVGRTITEVFKILDASNRNLSLVPADSAWSGDDDLRLPPTYILIRRGGVIIPIEHCVSVIHDRVGRAVGTVTVFRDVSAARALAQQMVHFAEHDFLTGLPNRMLLDDRIGQVIGLARRHTKQVAVLFLDLDGFKNINDSLGHPVGDKLLQSIAKRLGSCVRASDTVSRQGGDEFVVLLSEVKHPEDAAIFAERILQAVATTHHIDQHELQITTSIGVSVYPDDGLDAETLIKNADTAMYQAKENGRQGFQFFRPAMNVSIVKRKTIENNIRRALERQEFALHYQPKVNLSTGVITGAEALIRWMHPELGSIAPAQFIPAAEESSLILPIGAWVLREACRQARLWLEAGLPKTTMAVNVSAVEFRNKDFLDGLFAVLNETGLDPSFLELEITESVLMTNVEATASILQSLREIGVQIAIDDFGTGYSSLSYLQKFPVNALKIDQSFVRQIRAAHDESAIVVAVIAMAQSLKLRVIAEGVENEHELAFLRKRRCDEAQGYYFSPAMPPEAFAKVLETGFQDKIASLDLNQVSELGLKHAPGVQHDKPHSGFPGRLLGQRAEIEI